MPEQTHALTCAPAAQQCLEIAPRAESRIGACAQENTVARSSAAVHGTEAAIRAFCTGLEFRLCGNGQPVEHAPSAQSRE